MAMKKATRRQVRPPIKVRKATKAATPLKAGTTKLDAIVTALRAPAGASISDLMTLTGWQAHSVRGALSGALKKERGLTINSTKTDGERVYRIEARK